MRFHQLSIRNFRNLDSQTVRFNTGLNIFRGQNGQGKTNLIEAIHLITMGRSFRSASGIDLINKNNPSGFYLDAQLEKNSLGFRVIFLGENNRKQVAVNNKKWSSARLRLHFSSILFSPESLQIVKESAQKRRDLIDELATSLYPKFIKVQWDYQRLMKQKRALLKQIREEKISGPQGEKVNDYLSQQMLAKGADLCFYRLNAIQDIEPVLLQEFLNIMDDHYGNLSIAYLISKQKVTTLNRDQLLNAMYKRWMELKDREVATGQCLVGPHKHDIDFVFNGENARFFCSQGQQRAIVLAFKMAQIKLHYRAHKVFPILLLDDVLSELDREKQMRFVNYLLSTRAQILLTTTDATPLPEMVSSSVFDVNEGHFEEHVPVVTGGLDV
jgi:DNA replication and repair protein RecF